MNGICVLLVDNYPQHLQLFRVRLLESGRIKEVFAAGNYEEAVRLIQPLGERISLAVVDWQLGEKNGGDLVQYIKQHFPKMKTIVISIHEYVKDLAETVGAEAYFDKSKGMENLEEVLDSLGF